MHQLMKKEVILKVNLNGSFYCSYEALKIFKKKRRGIIINIGSINAYQAFPKNPGYVSSKGGLISLTRSLALDYSRYGVRVNSISPGYIKTNMTKKKIICRISNGFGNQMFMYAAYRQLFCNEKCS